MLVLLHIQISFTFFHIFFLVCPHTSNNYVQYLKNYLCTMILTD